MNLEAVVKQWREHSLHFMMSDLSTSQAMLNVSLLDARAYIDALDLDYIIETMCSSGYALPRWTLSDARHCCRLYKNFLILQKIHITEALVPTREIDEFWHNHILFTKRYLMDCMHIFGRYLHHSPALPGDDLQSLVSEFQKTKDYYSKEFNQPLTLLK